jgi:chemotaxis protein MotA
LNVFSLVAFLMAGGVLAFGIIGSGHAALFFNEHAFLIVIGGTVAASSISFHLDRLITLFRVGISRVLNGRNLNYVNLIETLIKISEAYRLKNVENINKLVNEYNDFFLKDAVALMQDELFEEHDLLRVLRGRVNTIFQRQNEEVMKFKAIGKFPPAFGLMGTTLSMIDLLTKLGEPGAQALIGPAMAVGLVATFYGLAIANLLFTPVGENLMDGTRESKIKNLIIVEGIRLVMSKSNPVVLAEELNSYLLASERIDWKKLSGNGPATKAA